MNYLKARVYALAAFAVAAKRDMPEAVTWVRRVLSVRGDLNEPVHVPLATMHVPFPSHDAVNRERLPATPSTYWNRIMTGMRLCALGESEMLPSEQGCLMDFYGYIKPVVDKMPVSARSEVNHLMNAPIITQLAA